MSVLRFESVSKQYPGGHPALVDVSFQVEEGEMLFVTGHSGAGKSTLLKLIHLSERPSRGAVVFNDHNLLRVRGGKVALHRRQVGVVYQDHRLLTDRSIGENVALPLILRGTRRGEIGKRVRSVLERMGLETARGSSSRGGVKALLAAARRMRESGICGCVTVDGPRGPRHEVKEGAIFLAARADAPIVPIRLFMERRKVFKSWDRFQLPLPFSRVSMVCADAYRVECDIRDPEAVARECRRLEEKLEALKAPELPPSPSLQIS